MNMLIIIILHMMKNTILLILNSNNVFFNNKKNKYITICYIICKKEDCHINHTSKYFILWILLQKFSLHVIHYTETKITHVYLWISIILHCHLKRGHHISQMSKWNKNNIYDLNSLSKFMLWLKSIHQKTTLEICLLTRLFINFSINIYIWQIYGSFIVQYDTMTFIKGKSK